MTADRNWVVRLWNPHGSSIYGPFTMEKAIRLVKELDHQRRDDEGLEVLPSRAITPRSNRAIKSVALSRAL